MSAVRLSLLVLCSAFACAQQPASQSSQPASAPAPAQSSAQPQQKPSGGLLQLQTLSYPKLQEEPSQQANTSTQQPDATKPTAGAAKSDAAQAPQKSDAQKADPSTQTPDGPVSGDESQAPTITRVVNEKSLIFTVTDKHNKFVKNLTKDAFVVLDDNKPPAKIDAFRAETDLPLRVGLLVDASNSIRERFKFEQEAAIEFLSSIIRPKKDQAFVIGFDTTPEVTQDFTGDTEKLSNGVRMLRPGGGTAMYDALYGACRDKLEHASSKDGSVRRAIILLSDGEDNQSRVTRDEAIEMAQRAEVIVYAISTNVSGTQSRGDKILEKIAESTGGRAFFPFKIEDVANAFSDVQEELRSQYAISYKPADFESNGRYRSLQVSANDKKLHVRAPKGYYAPRSEPVAAASGSGSN